MSTEKNSGFKDSLNLPQTDLAIVNNHKLNDAKILDFWKEQSIYQSVFHKNFSDKNRNQQFVLHWGPPYTNGPIHIGHVLSEVLKDLIVKSKQKSGYSIHFKTGWDCHGLPIENKVAALSNLTKDAIALDPASFKKACREYARGWIEVQKEEFQKLGIIADFENFYATMSPDYEATIMNCFADLVDDGYITQRHKTVSWCHSCATVLAVAEIEYKDRKDPSIFVKFELCEESQNKFKQKLGLEFSESISFLVWTTTPWTLPLNKALICHPTAEYALVLTEDQYLIIGSSLVSKLFGKFGKEFKIITTFVAGEILNSLKVKHIVNSGEEVPVLFEAEMVSLEDGTAIVHCAPGCGPEDYLVGMKNSLEIYSPVNAEGRYTSDIKLEGLLGMSVNDGQGFVIKHLAETGKLYFKENITHSYPHCWRCHQGIIFRATKQWFCDLSHNNLQQEVLKEIEKIDFIPSWGKTRFESFVGNRTEWCISRQRFWGVPIVAMKCNSCGEGYTDKKLVNFVADKVAVEGIECWDNISLEDLQNSGVVSLSMACKTCNATSWTKEQDILDVWFDSGVSHAAVLKKESEALLPADMYLEGSDQHRGWFNSSIFTSVALNKERCMSTILTHGFVLDQSRDKMSKSKGNVLAPQNVIEQYGADVLRAWVATSAYESDVMVSTDIFKNCAEICRKIRNTCRFMLSNLFDIDRKQLLADNYLETYDWKKLCHLDRNILVKLSEVLSRVDKAFAEYEFTAVMRELNAFCINDLSAGYFDMVRDTLYVEAADNDLRKSAQMTFMLILDCIIHRLAPILSFMAEDLYQHFSQSQNSVFAAKQPSLSILQQILQKMFDGADKEVFCDGFALLALMRKYAFEKIERLREVGSVKQSLESKLEIVLRQNSDAELLFHKLLVSVAGREEPVSLLKRYLGVSFVDISMLKSKTKEVQRRGFFSGVLEFLGFRQKQNSSESDVELQNNDSWQINASVASGLKCPRCWQWHLGEGDGEDLCHRCKNLISKS